MVSVLAAAILGTLPFLSSVQAFAPLAPAPASKSQRAHRSVSARANGIRLRSASSDDGIDGEDFDPFAQSPNSFGTDVDDSSPIGTACGTISTFGFLSYINEEANDAQSTPADETSAASDADLEFDPLLSPHAYVDGADAATTTTQTKTEQQQQKQQQQTIPDPDLVESQKQEQQTAPNPNTNSDVDMEFDPLLSPHAYANGVDSAPVDADADAESPFTVMATQRTTQQQQKKKKLGILLIDHGSRRQASNEHIHNVASMYENQLNQKSSSSNTSASASTSITTTTTTTVVRAAHMEISAPSIIDSLRNIIAVDKVDKVVCVPYFLSPGRHATEDIPQLLAEAKELLKEDGMESVDILMSEALGTHLESMLGAVDNLVEMTLNQ